MSQIELIQTALMRAYYLGQTYWQQADSEFTSEHKKADATQRAVKKLVDETCQAIEQAEKVEPISSILTKWKTGMICGQDAMVLLFRHYSSNPAAPTAPAQPAVDVNEMVNRFLGWKFPRDFAPDGAIRFLMKGRYEGFDLPQCWPVGTNLFTADQAKAMFEHCLATAPAQKPLTPAMLIDATLSASASGLISGTTNWAAHMLQHIKGASL